MSGFSSDVTELPDVAPQEVVPQLGIAPIAVWTCPSCNMSAQSTDKRLIERLSKKVPCQLDCRCGHRLLLKIPLIHAPKFKPQIIRKET